MAKMGTNGMVYNNLLGVFDPQERRENSQIFAFWSKLLVVSIFNDT